MIIKIAVFCALISLVCSGTINPEIDLKNLLGSRIVGGSEADLGEFPHQVSLQWGLFSFLVKHFCGGSILSDKWILTAGHCVNAVPKIGRFVVKAGKLEINTKEPTEQTSVVDKSFVHPSYSGDVGPNDIALLKLKTGLIFNENVLPISLPPINSEPEGKVILSGWGSISDTNDPVYPNILQKVELPVINYCDCKLALNALLGPAEDDLPFEQTNVCTGPLDGGYSACSGDSGGPLISVNSYSGETEIVGIVSWGVIPCGSTGAPSVYTRVSSFIPYILTTINDNLS